jgi:hypothetical protein
LVAPASQIRQKSATQFVTTPMVMRSVRREWQAGSTAINNAAHPKPTQRQKRPIATTPAFQNDASFIFLCKLPNIFQMASSAGTVDPAPGRPQGSGPALRWTDGTVSVGNGFHDRAETVGVIPHTHSQGRTGAISCGWRIRVEEAQAVRMVVIE